MATTVSPTVTETLARGVVALASSSDSARADATLLLARALGKDREWLVAHGDGFLSSAQTERFRALCELRASGMPVAYILRSAWFCGREFVVNNKVLIPRPETEHLVDEAVEHLRSLRDPALPKAVVRVLDVGTGCGAIACSIAAEVQTAAVDCTDASSAAIAIAKTNARRLNVYARCTFYVGNLAEPIGERAYDVVVANLPYIPTADVPEPPNPVGYEPRTALDGGPDGLTYYRRLLASAPGLLRPGAMLLMEAAPPVMVALAQATRLAFPKAAVDERNDYAGLARYVRVTIPNTR